VSAARSIAACLRTIAIICFMCALSSGVGSPLASGPLPPATTSALAQEPPPALLDEAARRTGLSRQELLRRYREQGGDLGPTVDTLAVQEPGRQDIEGIDDRQPAGRVPRVVLPGWGAPPHPPPRPPRDQDEAVVQEEELQVFGADFFRLDPGVFQPASFGPVPENYLVGVGDEIVVDVWGEVEFRLERVVDRDGTIILPRGGKISCANRTLAQLARAVRERLSRSYSGIASEPGKGTTFLDVSLGRLRAIRVFVVGDAMQPGAYELTSVATVFTALHAAGGPAPGGSLREVRLVRGDETVAELDLYAYLLAGKREGDAILREGDTVYIPPRGRSVALRGAVRRQAIFELREQEGLADLLGFGGGFLPEASTELVHVRRILSPAERQPERPDVVLQDVALDLQTGAPADSLAGALRDGDEVSVDRVPERLENWVEVTGNVKRPGRYQHRPGMGVSDLVRQAGGLWSDTLGERALIDRIAADGTYQSVDVPLGDVLAGRARPVPLAPRDRLRIFSRWDVQDRQEVAITGEVRSPGSFPYREGLTLRDLVLKAGGLKESADLLKAEVSRLNGDGLSRRDPGAQPDKLVDLITVELGEDYLRDGGNFQLMPHDRVAIRRLPWWELQRTVTVKGEVYYPGVYALERPDERLADVIARAGGLKPTAFAPGARIERNQDAIGNVALDLHKALREPGRESDIVLRSGDMIVIPEQPQTVTVVGAVGYPTSIVHEDGMSIGEYVNRAGGYAEGADKWKTRVVYPNGMSRKIRRIWRDPSVMPGSTIVVPAKPPDDGPSKLETIKDIAAIFASAATMYLVIDRAAD
jgi:polysaccharide export outer membrane protein